MMGRKPVFEEFAPAKINLYLRVGAPGPDGFHPLDSVAAFASIGDWVRVTPARGLTLQVTGAFAGPLLSERDNLVLRAARALGSAFGIDQDANGAAIHLEKNLPVASGIGGGSADAAAALRALSRLWNVPSEFDLTGIAAKLGADVPACLYGKSVLMRGIGDVLSPIATPKLGVVLANAGELISTPAVYRQFDARGLGGGFEHGRLSPASDAKDFASGLRAHPNDLESPAFIIAPGIRSLKEDMGRLQECELARMSGSGGTVFGLFAGEDAAHKAADALRDQRPNDWIQAGVLNGST